MEYSSAAFSSDYTDVEAASGADAYHYTRTEFRCMSISDSVTSKTRYGFGLVSAETNDIAGAFNWDNAYGAVY